MKETWVTTIRDQCTSAGVPFFFKQWGGVRKRKTGRVLGTRTYDERPPHVLAPVPDTAQRHALIARAKQEVRVQQEQAGADLFTAIP